MIAGLGEEAIAGGGNAYPMPIPFRIPIFRRISGFCASAAAMPNRSVTAAIPMSVFKLASHDLLKVECPPVCFLPVNGIAGEMFREWASRPAHAKSGSMFLRHWTARLGGVRRPQMIQVLGPVETPLA